MPRPSRREDLIDTAIGLFCEHGFHGVGIDMLLEKAGMSKKTMYNHFRSKEELIYAALQKHGGVFRNNVMKAVEANASEPDDKILAVFDVAENWFRNDTFFGCMFVGAINEYSAVQSPIRDISINFKKMMRDYFYDLSIQANTNNPGTLADELALLLEGAVVTAQVSQKPEAAQTAKRIAARLIKDQA